MSRSWNWWIPAEGITREVIQVDIQRYLGPDAVCKPGVGTGQYQVSSTVYGLARSGLIYLKGVPGYYISAYRNFTPVRLRSLARRTSCSSHITGHDSGSESRFRKLASRAETR